MGSYDADTKFEGVRVHLTWPDRDHDICVTGRAINKSDGAWVDGIKKVRKTAAHKSDLDFIKGNVINSVVKQLETIEHAKIAVIDNRAVIDTSNIMVNVFYKLFAGDIDDSVKDTPYYIYPWGPTTQRAHLVYFHRNVLPVIQKYEFDSDFTEVEKNDLIQKLSDVALNRMDRELSIDILEEAKTIAIKHMNEADRIYSELRYNCPTLPDIDLRVEMRRRRKKTEQLKRLPFFIHKNFRLLIEEAINTQPYYARAAILMDSAGERSGEAAAAWQGLFEDHGSFMVVWVMEQDDRGRRTDRLKSKSSYRYIVLDEWGMTMLRRCNSIIGPESREDNSSVKDIDLSGWVRNKLREAGCTDEYLRDAYDDMTYNPEFSADGKPVRDIAAHIMRRNRASIWRNYCAYTQDELDYALGHANRKKLFEKANMLSSETLANLAYKNSRYDMFPDITINPKHKPVSITDEQEMSVMPFDEYRIKNDSDAEMVIDFDLLAMEAGEIVSIELPQNVKYSSNQRSTPQTRFCRREAFVIGVVDEKDKKEFDGEYEESDKE